MVDMGLMVVIVGLAALSLVVVVAARRGNALPAWRLGQPISRGRVAGVIVIGAIVVGVAWFIFQFVWWYMFGCCKP